MDTADTSSIVSFNNESTLKADYSASGTARGVNVHELALHAMRDRCLLLQRRIHTLENDNMRLKLATGDCEPCRPIDDDERRQLRTQLAELSKQKAQLMHHVFMVTCENKNLWNRLASIKVTKRDLPPSNYSALENSPPKHGRLLRTNTYIHSTPRVDVGQEKYSDASLEEISLKLINSFIQEKSQLVEQYEQMAEMQCEEDILNLDSIGFAYLEEHHTDSLKEVRSQTEKLMQLKKELLIQETELMTILSSVEKNFCEDRKCNNCALNGSAQVATENKEIETSDSLVEWATPAHSNSYHEQNLSEINTVSQSLSAKDSNTHSDKINNQSEPSNDLDKMCPMCGQVFRKGYSFAEFQQHVENHFIGDPDPDSIDYDNIVTNSVDNDYI